MELGPLHDLLGLASAANLGRHDTAGTCFERTHHRCVIGGGQAHKRVDTGGASGAGALFDLLDGQAGVLLVEPNGIIAAMETDDLDQSRATEVTDSTHADQLSIGQ